MRFHSKRNGIYRSGVEKAVGEALALQGLPALYEAVKLHYTQARRYTPDFTIGDSHIEVKGWWPSSDRAKLLAVIHSNPTTRILVALENPHMTLNKKSKTTYAQWCIKHGIEWSPIPIPSDLLTQWLSKKRPTFRAQAQTATVRMVQPNTQMDLFSVSSAKADTTGTAQHGNGP
jgi:hypothetical protein